MDSDAVQKELCRATRMVPMLYIGLITVNSCAGLKQRQL